MLLSLLNPVLIIDQKIKIIINFKLKIYFYISRFAICDIATTFMVSIDYSNTVQ